MAIHPYFTSSPHTILNPHVCWCSADEALRESSHERLMPPLAHKLRGKTKKRKNGKLK